MSNKTTFTYTADDGSAGAAFPLHATVFLDDLLGCDTDEEAYTIVADCIEDDFHQKVSPSWDETEVRAKIAALRKGEQS